MADNIKRVGATLDAAGEYTDWISPSFRSGVETLNLGIDASSDFSGSVILELTYTYDSTTYTRTVATYTEDAQKIVEDHVNGVKYRLRMTERSAGSVEAELYRDNN